MSSTSSIALSGMNAAQTALQVAAHNVANLATPAFRRELVVQATRASGGTSTALRRAQREGNALEADMVAQLQAKHSFLANLAVFRAGDSMTGVLLDALG